MQAVLTMTVYRLTEAERQTYRRYASLALPRHTSYPIASAWTPAYGPADFRHDLRRSAGQARPLSLYVHIPFCERLCYYCACTKEIVPPAKRQAADPGEPLLEGLDLETGRFADAVGPGEVRQVHLGGGSPTFLSPAQLHRLGNLLRHRFDVARDAEMAVEVDPRITTLEHLLALRSLGFNRISLGVQDFAPAVQRAVNRIQPFEQVERLVGWCRSLGFASLNFDLIYGLPFQTLATMADTLAKTVALAPDRIAFYRLAVIPEMFRWQNVFRPSDLPAGDLPLELNLLAINRFLEAGYEFIGLDHFARPDEALARARQDGSLRRNFQGMTTGKELDILGLGPSAISQLDAAFAQNAKASADWQRAVTQDLATERGLRLTDDDRLRRELMQQLYGYGTIDARALEHRFGIVFDEYFAGERWRLGELVEQGLVLVEPGLIRLTAPLGRLLVRVVAAVFDRYLPANAFRDGLPAHLSSKVG
jgi:oxygen-independent coproporphyrinogen-3 oxidase